jgi:hypothetical protein
VGAQQCPWRGCPDLPFENDPANARVLVREYAEEVNNLAATPRFYNTLAANCTNLVFDMVRVIHPGVPMDAPSSSPAICLITPTISVPPIRACPSRSCATFPRSTTRQRWPMPIPISQREFERGSRYAISAAETLVVSPISPVLPFPLWVTMSPRTAKVERQLSG